MNSLLAFLLFSCTHHNFRSGQYIILEEGDTIETLGLEYGVSPAAILNANKDKEFVPGQRIFIPLRRGVLDQVLDHEIYYSDYPYSEKDFFGGAFLWPVPASTRISSLYGQRGERFHHGIDIPAPPGSPILAAEDGTVIHSGQVIRGYGNLTIISHEGKIFTIYAHAKKNLTKKGQKVYRGQIIAEVGSTGKSTGPHLHFEIRKRQKSLDPMEFLNSTKIGQK